MRVPAIRVLPQGLRELLIALVRKEVLHVAGETPLLHIVVVEALRRDVAGLVHLGLLIFGRSSYEALRTRNMSRMSYSSSQRELGISGRSAANASGYSRT